VCAIIAGGHAADGEGGGRQAPPHLRHIRGEHHQQLQQEQEQEQQHQEQQQQGQDG
jgi:hypothetical protein